MDGKLTLVKLTWPAGAIEITDFDGLANVIKDYMADSGVGDEWSMEIVEMEQEAFDNLPEFMGP